MYTYTYIFIHMFVFESIWAYIYVNVYICIYVLHTYMYVCTYLYTCIHHNQSHVYIHARKHVCTLLDLCVHIRTFAFMYKFEHWRRYTHNETSATSCKSCSSTASLNRCSDALVKMFRKSARYWICYGVATINRLLKIIRLFCRSAL